MPIIPKTINNWKPWSYLNNVIAPVQYPDVALPYSYVPASGFWIQSLLSNCLIPWLNTPSTFDLFLLGGGSSPNITGSISGLSVASDLINVSNASQTFAIGRGARPPTMGYCIGNKFKQHIYTRMDVQNDGIGGTSVTNVGIDLLQNSRFKRIYVHSGNIVGYTSAVSPTSGSTEYLLDIGITKTEPPPSGIAFSANTISIVRAGNNNVASVSMTVNVLSIKNNWDLVISQPPQEILAGDYYELSKTLCIEDPYLLSGFWLGSESSLFPPVASSGLDLYKTSHNSPYEEGKFLGVYIWQSNASSVTITSTSLQPIPGLSMNDSGGNTWAFLGFGNSVEYPVYPNDKRYVEVRLEAPDSSGSLETYKERTYATSSDYSVLRSTMPSYLRVEIGTGGYTSRHNWYAPCLNGQFLKNNGKLYRILGHVTFNVIDVSFLDIEGQTEFDPLTNQKYSIVNEYGWLLNEHYDDRISSHTNAGVFKGTVTDVSGNRISIMTEGDTYISSSYKSNGLSFINRYQQDIVLTSFLEKCFQKYMGWKLVVKDGSEYNISSVDFSMATNEVSTPYPIVVDLQGVSNVNSGDIVYMAFDTTFNTFGYFSKEGGYSFNLKVTPSLEGTGAGTFIISDHLCIDGEFYSNPYKLAISSSDRVGFTEGYLFGLASNGSAQSDYSQAMILAVPSTAVGTSSLFHSLRNEDWIAFQDSVTGKISIRKGSLYFIEFPKKEMVAFGNSFSFTSTSNPILLNSNYSMTRRITLSFPSSSSSSDLAILFGIGNVNNIYGFYVSGDGTVDLLLYQRQGASSGTISNSRYTGYGYDVSPCYLYKPSYFYAFNPSTIDVGVPTSEGSIYLADSNLTTTGVSSDSITTTVEYVQNKQTLSQIGYYDIMKLKDGEILLIYGLSTGAFNLANNSTSSALLTTFLNNSPDNGSQWTNPNAVMIMGTNNNMWRSPLSDGVGNNQYPLMLINSVDYLTSLYNSHENSIVIFIRCLDGQNNAYLGCYVMPVTNLQNSSYFCSPLSSSVSNFSWKPPLIQDSFMSNTSKSWTNTLVEDGYSFPFSTEGFKQESFFRIMGTAFSNSQIVKSLDEDFGIISSAILDDGTYVVLYDSVSGIKMAFSIDCGDIWHDSNIILYKNAKNAIMIGMYLFAITSNGIEMKLTDFSDFKKSVSIGLMDAGIDRTNAEIALQDILDDSNQKKRILIGSGTVESQRLSGHIISDGTVRVFFYDANNLLKCMESSDQYHWRVANNF